MKSYLEEGLSFVVRDPKTQKVIAWFACGDLNNHDMDVPNYNPTVGFRRILEFLDDMKDCALKTG